MGQVIVRDVSDAHEQIDRAISTALAESKPVYISVSCNIANVVHPSFVRDPVPYSVNKKCVTMPPAVGHVASQLHSINADRFQTIGC